MSEHSDNRKEDLPFNREISGRTRLREEQSSTVTSWAVRGKIRKSIEMKTKYTVVDSRKLACRSGM